MAFLNKASVIGTTNNILYSSPIGQEASIHTLFVSNPSASSEDVTIKIYNQSTATTVSSLTETIAAGGTYLFPKPINMATQDQLILISSGATAVATLSIFSQSEAGVDAAIALEPKGAWSAATTYEKLEVVDYLGSSYVAITQNLNSTPPSVNWGLVASKGDAGTLSNVIEDTTPQLGGNLDLNGFDIPLKADLTTNTFTGAQILSDQEVSRALLIDFGFPTVDKGNSGTTTQTYDYTAGSVQTSTVTGAHTIAISNWPPTGNLGELLLILTNAGSAAVTWPTISWLLPDGTTSTAIATYLAANGSRVALQSSGVDQVLLWTRDAGTTIYGKLV